MTQHENGREDELLARAGWPRVIDALLWGLSGDLAGRVASLEGMVALSRLGEDFSSVTPFLDQEVAHLKDVVTLQRLLVGDGAAEPEPIDPGEALPMLLDLQARHRGLEQVSVVLDIDTPGPLLLPWRTLSRALLCATSAAAREALLRDRRVDLVVHGTEGEVEFRWTATGQKRPDAYGITLPEVSGRPEGLVALANLLGGSWTLPGPDGLPVWVLTLPAMSRG